MSEQDISARALDAAVRAEALGFENTAEALYQIAALWSQDSDLTDNEPCVMDATLRALHVHR